MKINWFRRRKKTTLPPFKVEQVTGALSQVQGWGIKQLNVPATWTVTKGEFKTALVIDTGFTSHSDLVGAVIKEHSKSFIPRESYVDDEQGHSTHCCGIIGARNNNEGMVGVAPACNILTAKALDSQGTGSMRALEQALEYAILIKPDVVSMSLGSPQGTARIHNLIKKLYAMDIPVICAAGNSGRRNDVNYPAKYPETIAVTAFDKNGKAARFNSTGSQVDVSAPGVDIYSTWLGNGYAKLSGTSMACPFITGLVLLLLAKHEKQEKETGKNDCKTVDQVKQHLIKYADDKGVVGRDNVWGYGVVDPTKLILAAADDEVEVVPTPPVEPPKKPDNMFRKLARWFRKRFR